MQHTAVFLTVFVIVIVTMVFLGSFLLVGRLVRLVVRRQVFKCGLQTLTKILEAV